MLLIARLYNTTIDNLRRLNNLDGNNLQIGQTLIIEEDTPITNTYVVKRGDTLYSIARQLNTTVNDLRRLNNLDSNIISINQILKY